MRIDCTVLVYIDLERALEDGYAFYEGAKGVILCAGNDNGFLAPRYFAKAIDVKTGANLIQ